MRVFHHLLANNLVANITNFTVWFALTFWVYLETRSVFATGVIAGLYLVLTAGLLGMGFTVPVIALETALPGGVMTAAAARGLALSLLAGRGALAAARLLRRQN